ncbi:hypothetical protein Syun_001034 [Stephania yunnanensis]|uniref:Uncharacterized protein n=1 Tax=Stephania yunnanensis TaxID=152371 RepID=A0AAP0Q7C6_9MAGN
MATESSGIPVVANKADGSPLRVMERIWTWKLLGIKWTDDTSYEESLMTATKVLLTNLIKAQVGDVKTIEDYIGPIVQISDRYDQL